MSQENKIINCVQCGSENPEAAKFCSNCGAKLEKEISQETSAFSNPESNVYNTPQEDLFKEPVQPLYEKVEGETVQEGNFSSAQLQPEININYDAESRNSYSSDEQTGKPKYYSSAQTDQTQNGSIGFAIASMVCGILSIICCCFSFFSLALGIAAIVLGIVAINGKYDGKGMAIAGIVTGGIGITVLILAFVIGGATGIVSDVLDELYY